MPTQLIEKEKVKTPFISTDFIYEEMDGKPIYYKGYQETLKKNLDAETIMGASEIQSLIIACIVEFLNVRFYPQKIYKTLYSELGMHLSMGNNLSADIAIYERERLKKYDFKGKYIEIAPKIIIEVDVQADMTDFTSTFDYIETKTEKLLEFGAEKVFWVLSQNKKVMIFSLSASTKKLDWKIVDWEEEITILENCTFSVEKLIKEDGILIL